MKVNKTSCYPCMLKRLTDICYKHQLHHLGSYYTSLEIIDEIYQKMRPEDIFILSAGHAVVALYVTLEKYYGFDAEALLAEFGEHPKLCEEKKLHCSTGSLGMGLPVAVGRALGNPNRTVFCLISDGECAEGSVWESLAVIKALGLKNIKVYVNINGYSAYDKLDTVYLSERLRAFMPDIAINYTTHYLPYEGLAAHYSNMTKEEYEKLSEFFSDMQSAWHEAEVWDNL